MPYEDNSINLYLNGNRINGLESLDVAVAPQSESLDYIGNMGRQNVRSSYPISKLSLSKRHYGPDNFINLFSGRGINGYILVNGQTGNNLAFLSGYLTNYSINFGLNQTPSIACDFEFYNNFGQLNITGAPFVIGNSGYYYLNAAAPEDYVFATQAVVHTGLKQISLYQENPLFYFRTGDSVYFSGRFITGINSIINSQSSGFTGYIYRKETYPIVSSKGVKLDIDDARNNNLIQASVNFSFPRLPIYDLGSVYPSEVHSLYPTDVVCTLDFEPDNYSVFNQGSWPPVKKTNTLDFRMYDRSGTYVDTLTLGSMELISEKASVGLDGTYRISAEYKKKQIITPFSIETLPNLAFYFHADDTSGSTPATWTDRTNTCEVVRTAGGNLRFGTEFTTLNTKRGFVAENDFYNHIQLIGGSPVFPYGQAFPTDCWMVVLVAPDPNGGNLLGRPFLTTTLPFMSIQGVVSSGSGGIMYPMAICGNSSSFNAVDYNNPTAGTGPVEITVNKHVIMLMQNTSINGAGRFRLNGTERNYRPSPNGLTDFTTAGSNVSSHIGFGCSHNTVNTITRANIRAVICGRGRLSLDDMEKIEGILATDAGIRSSLPVSHPWYQA